MRHSISRTATIWLARTAVLLLVALIAALTQLPGSPVALAQDTGGEGQDCWACHRQANLNGISGTRTSIALCLDCHADPQVDEWAQAERTPLYMDASAYAGTVHGGIACVACHSDVARNPHRSEATAACADCHATILVHVNMGAPHMRTDCAACHREALPVIRDGATGRVVLPRVDDGGALLDRTDHGIVKEAACTKCHTAGNAVGAPAVTLPARSILCMACHDASPTVSVALLDATPVKTDYGAIAGLLVFGLGMVLNVRFYLRGQIPGHPGLTAMEKLNLIAADTGRLIFSRRIFRFLGGAVADGILLRRVLQESVGRWVMHTLIYLPFLARFGLGLLTWLGQAFWPSAAWTQTLSDKDAPGVALAYDLLTLLMILGVLFALVRRFILRDRRLRTFAQDKVAISLLGAILLVGILTEGIRLLSAGTPGNVAVYSFLGYAVAAVLRPLNLTWTSVYPVIWYLHAWLVVALIGYLPFSKFMHILAGPFIASLDSARKGGH
jgi:predicted CXXCH cytochrome family protein